MAKKSKKKFHARVEIYFVIYLATIISFFTIEGEVREYKQKQEDILVQVAKDKMRDFVEVERVEPFVDEDSLEVRMKVIGEFDRSTFEGAVTFREALPEGSGETPTEVEAPLRPEDEPNWYAVALAKSKFGDDADKNYTLHADFSIMPDFSEELIHDWEERFQDREVVETLVQKIKDVGSVTLPYTHTNPIALSYEARVSAPFVMRTPRESYNVLQGLEWDVPVYIGGVKETGDFDLRVTAGNNLITGIDKSAVETVVRGRGSSSGEIRLAGTRRSDSETTSLSFRINVSPPTWENSPRVSTVYLGEEYTFDGRLRDIASSDISVQVSGSAVEAHTVNGSQVPLGPFENTGDVQFQVLVNDVPIGGMSHMITVQEPPPPKVELYDRSVNTLIFTITTYGKNNGIRFVRRRGGIRQINEQEGPTLQGSKSRYKYSVEIEEPYDGAQLQEISFLVEDQYGQSTEHRKQYQYNY